jgi:60 kDa SS-A/Ro ribonucleoprotein
MNLNTFARHGVFGDDVERSDEQLEVAKIVAERMRDRQAIAKARAFPYQLMVAYANADTRVPGVVKEALQDAMEIALENVPSIAGKVYVLPDLSGSMQSPVTGSRGVPPHLFDASMSPPWLRPRCCGRTRTRK